MYKKLSQVISAGHFWNNNNNIFYVYLQKYNLGNDLQSIWGRIPACVYKLQISSD